MEALLFLNFIGPISLLIAAWLYMRSQSVRTNIEETSRLAQTRGERIEDLQAEVSRLETRLSHLEGQMEAVQRLKSQEIAMEVSQMLHDQFIIGQKRDQT